MRKLRFRGQGGHSHLVAEWRLWPDLKLWDPNPLHLPVVVRVWTESIQLPYLIMNAGNSPSPLFEACVPFKSQCSNAFMSSVNLVWCLEVKFPVRPLPPVSSVEFITLFSCCLCSDWTWQSLSHVWLLVTFTTSYFAQIHVHWVHDAIQPSHPVLFQKIIIYKTGTKNLRDKKKKKLRSLMRSYVLLLGEILVKNG